jgi:hypothetical protein
MLAFGFSLRFLDDHVPLRHQVIQLPRPGKRLIL